MSKSKEQKFCILCAKEVESYPCSECVANGRIKKVEGEQE